jgi:hypothetical protein
MRGQLHRRLCRARGGCCMRPGSGASATAFLRCKALTMCSLWSVPRRAKWSSSASRSSCSWVSERRRRWSPVRMTGVGECTRPMALASYRSRQSILDLLSSPPFLGAIDGPQPLSDAPTAYRRQWHSSCIHSSHTVQYATLQWHTMCPVLYGGECEPPRGGQGPAT